VFPGIIASPIGENILLQLHLWQIYFDGFGLTGTFSPLEVYFKYTTLGG